LSRRSIGFQKRHKEYYVLRGRQTDWTPNFALPTTHKKARRFKKKRIIIIIIIIIIVLKRLSRRRRFWQ